MKVNTQSWNNKYHPINKPNNSGIKSQKQIHNNKINSKCISNFNLNEELINII